jgi:23S rRNA pseudouridine1911/1915/1917 synthase
MTVTKSSGRSAITNYCIKEIYQEGAFSLVKCQLETGRTHQIRVHMTSIGHSLVGDQTYGNSNKVVSNINDSIQNLVNDFPRQALHSYKISFLHPISKKEMTFETDLPEDIKNLKDQLFSKEPRC